MTPAQPLEGQSRVTSPRGDEFEIIDPAERTALESAPSIPAEAGEEYLVVKEGDLFACSGRSGDMSPRGRSGEGFYFSDTRFLAELRLTVGGAAPVMLASSGDLAYQAVVDATNPELAGTDESRVPQMTLNIHRTRLLSDRLYERVDVRNHGRTRARTTLEIHLAADFADIFEVRGHGGRKWGGQELAPRTQDASLSFAYIGADGSFRETVVEFKSHPHSIDSSNGHVVVRWDIDLPPRGQTRIELSVEASIDGRRRRRRSFDTAATLNQKSKQEWDETSTLITTDRTGFNRLLESSSRDIRALITPEDHGRIIAAGIPWYVAPFGRDSLLTSVETLLMTTNPARETLFVLANHQSRNDDRLRDAEPGKILHEIRYGELARAGHIPHSPYYGTADATPLFVMVAADYYRWTNDLDTMLRLRPHLDAALAWIDKYGDRDGDGFVEYVQRSPVGLRNNGWKDSFDSIVHEDGSLAEGPIALAEVQGYTYAARRGIAEVYDALGHGDVADELRTQSDNLKTAFNDSYWMPEEGFYAMALDGDKKQVKSVASNPGHCLYCGIVDEDRAGAVCDRLMGPDMFSGWGIRTLSSDSPAYNPMSYHTGSVWPHDNAIIAAGFKRYGRADLTSAVVSAMYDAALESPELRLPELYCGFERQRHIPYVQYPVACSPQAWSAAAPFALLQSLLGITADAPNDQLTIRYPGLPPWLTDVQLRNLRVGKSTLSLSFTKQGTATAFSLVDRDGTVRVVMQE
jgi:glycogen debranching enzyme